MESIRRISTTVFFLGALVVGITLLAQLTVQCPVGTECLGAALFTLDAEGVEGSSFSKNTTLQVGEQGRITDFAILHMVAQKVGIYLLLLAAIALMALEMKELHYLKALSRRRKKA